jgi:hypothetical protein
MFNLEDIEVAPLTFALEDLGVELGKEHSFLVTRILCHFLQKRYDDDVVLQEGAVLGLSFLGDVCEADLPFYVFHGLVSLGLRTKSPGIKVSIKNTLERIICGTE